jgi:hypothetical protein
VTGTFLTFLSGRHFDEGGLMDAVHEDRFEVFLRRDRNHLGTLPDVVEQPLASCSTYQEARDVRRLFHRTAGECVIRYVGPAGGGD